MTTPATTTGTFPTEDVTTVDRHPELEVRARQIVDANKYVVLGTSDGDGRAWVSPVYYTPVGYQELFWVSPLAAHHSQNIAGRPEVSGVVFDSQVPFGGAEAVYVTARADQVPSHDLARCADVFRARFPELREFDAEALRAPASLRLYRATIVASWLLIRGGDPTYGAEFDSRMRVSLAATPDPGPVTGER